MAATASLTTTAPSPPALLKASAPLLISFRPVSRHCKNLCIKTKATENDQSAKKPQKVKSILCQDCEGNAIQYVAPQGHLAPYLNNYVNEVEVDHKLVTDYTGAIACTKCEGSGVNSVDYFEGRFKAGSLCWLCRGKREILCGNCNGAGFLGGFLSTFDETAQ